MKILWCTGSWGTRILNDTEKVWIMCQSLDVPLRQYASCWMCQLGDGPVYESVEVRQKFPFIALDDPQNYLNP